MAAGSHLWFSPLSHLLQNHWRNWVESLQMDRVKRIWYLSPMRAAKVQASLRIRTVSPEPPLLAHTSSESRGTFRQKARSLASLNGWACAVKICNNGMLEDTNSLDGAHMNSSPCLDVHYVNKPMQNMHFCMLALLLGIGNASINHIQDESLLRKQRYVWNTNIIYTPENPNFTI